MIVNVSKLLLQVPNGDFIRKNVTHCLYFSIPLWKVIFCLDFIVRIYLCDCNKLKWQHTFYWFHRLYAIFFYFKLLWIIVYICHNLCTVKPVVSRALRDSWKCRSSGQAGQGVKALLILRLLRSSIRDVSPVTLRIPVLESVLEPGCSYQVGILFFSVDVK